MEGKEMNPMLFMRISWIEFKENSWISERAEGRVSEIGELFWRKKIKAY